MLQALQCKALISVQCCKALVSVQCRKAGMLGWLCSRHLQLYCRCWLALLACSAFAGEVVVPVYMWTA